MITNKLENDIIEKREINTWEQRKFEKMNNDFVEAIKKCKIRDRKSTRLNSSH